MTEFLLTSALLALFFAWYLVHDFRHAITLRHPTAKPPCDNCAAVAQTGVYFDGYRLQYLCAICHDEAEQAASRA